MKSKVKAEDQDECWDVPRKAQVGTGWVGLVPVASVRVSRQWLKSQAHQLGKVRVSQRMVLQQLTWYMKRCRLD